MYVEITGDSLIAFSDLHGNFESVDEHLTFLQGLQNFGPILFVGDAIDHWFPLSFNSDYDPDGKALLNSYDGFLNSFMSRCPSFASPEVFEALDAALSGKSYNNLPVGPIRRGLIGAMLSYETLRLLYNRPNLTFLLGNHEIDLLSGAWLYRSLQKCFLLNLFGVRGFWCLEFRDAIRGNSPIYQGREMAALHKVLLESGGQTVVLLLKRYDPIFQWLYSCPVIAGFKDWLFMHGGPTHSFITFIECVGHIEEVGYVLSYEVNKKGFGSALFRETGDAGDTFLAPSSLESHFMKNPTITDKCLSFFKKSYLGVGHSARLGTNDWSDPLTKRIAFVKKNILKLDVGLKRHLRSGYHYASIDHNSTKGIQFCDNRSHPFIYNP